MHTEIHKFIHDDGPEYQTLISLAGHFLTNPVIPSRLGAPITTKQRDIWLVAKVDDKPTGCAVITLIKTGPLNCMACMWLPMMPTMRCI
jgi:hypothetical protein